jgi:hypothetical protein
LTVTVLVPDVSMNVNELLVPDQVPRLAPFSVTIPPGSMVTTWVPTVHEQIPPELDKVVDWGVVEPDTVQLYVPLHGESGRDPPLLEVAVVPLVVPVVVPVVPVVVPVVVLLTLHSEEQFAASHASKDDVAPGQLPLWRDAVQPEIQLLSVH